MTTPGLGVMIQALGGNEETVKAHNLAVGRVIQSVALEPKDGAKNLVLTFSDGSTLTATDDGQSCCESRYMTCDDDLTSFVGDELVGLSLEDGPDVGSEYDYHEQQFLKVQTSRGSFTVANHNEHNGYYGGFWITLSFQEGGSK